MLSSRLKSCLAWRACCACQKKTSHRAGAPSAGPTKGRGGAMAAKTHEAACEGFIKKCVCYFTRSSTFSQFLCSA